MLTTLITIAGLQTRFVVSSGFAELAAGAAGASTTRARGLLAGDAALHHASCSYSVRNSSEPLDRLQRDVFNFVAAYLGLDVLR